ncbi:MAG: hypothetical protein EOP65_15995, partial [Sphingomonas sp.]
PRSPATSKTPASPSPSSTTRRRSFARGTGEARRQRVIPANAGTHGQGATGVGTHPRRPAPMGPGLRRDDERGGRIPIPQHCHPRAGGDPDAQVSRWSREVRASESPPARG